MPTKQKVEDQKALGLTFRGRIKLGRNTAKHPEILKKVLGEDRIVSESENEIIVSCSGFVTDQVDLSNDEAAAAALNDLKETGRLWTYKTPFLLPGGKVLSGMPALGSLKRLSAFVVKPVEKAGPTIDSVLD